MDSYFSKYLKYKNKYLSLRNLYGGVDPVELSMVPSAETIQSEKLSIKLAQSKAAANEINNSQIPSLMLLSEIANYTKKIYFSNKKIGEIEHLIPLLEQFNRIPNFLNDETRYMASTGFYQDEMIQLYDTRTRNYINLIHNNVWTEPIMTEYDPIEILKRNNITMIGDKTIDELPNTTFTKHKAIREITRLKQLGIVINEPSTHIISLSPHDIFFPLEANYINIHLINEKKIISDIIHESTPIQLLRDDFTTPNPATEINLSEQIKGGNFIASPPTPHAPNGVLFCINPITDQMLDFLQTHLIQPIVQLQCSFMFVDIDSIFRHIDEIMTFLPYGRDASGRGIFKVWFYDISTPQQPKQPSARLYDMTDPKIKLFYDNRMRMYDEEIRYIQDVIPQLRDEQRKNLNIISNALFGSDYVNNQDNFVIIPIDVNYPPHLFPKPPIFNSTYIEIYQNPETEEDKRISPQLFLSSNSNKLSNLDPIVIAELPKLHSFITGRPVQSHIINTNVAGIHTTIRGGPGGNLHCLIKQEMEYNEIQ